MPVASQPRLLEGQRVLVVDDEEAVRMIVSDMVTDLGGIVLTASDGPSAEALAAEERRLRFLLVISGCRVA